ncbi:hypothetical protein SLS64_008139 [Diaporthe eres]
MSSLIRATLCAASLVSLSNAAPANLKSTVQSRWEECPTGTWYSQCGQIAGCFDYDPCINPSQPSTPQPPPTALPTCSTDPKNPTRILPTTYWPINPNSPDQTYAAEGTVHVRNDTSAADGVVQQVLIFEGVDAGAKKCSVGWFLKMQEDTVFEVEGDGYVRITQLDGLARGQAPTYSSAIAAEKAGAATTMPAMGGWDDKSAYMGMTSGMMQEVACSDVLAFRAYLDPINDGEVYMEPSDIVGIAVTYTC